MQNSPQAIFETMSEIISLINKGFGPHRFSLSQGMMTFHNAEVNQLHKSIKAFQAKPSLAGFTAIIDSLKACQTQEIDSFAYDAILPMAEKVQAAFNPERKAKNRI